MAAILKTSTVAVAVAVAVEAEAEAEAEPLSPTARVFNAPMINCCIMCIIGYKTKIDWDVIVDGLKHTLIKHPRFSSKLEDDSKKRGKRPRWIRTDVNVEEHVIAPDIDPEGIENPDQFIDDYITHLTTVPLDTSRPLWEFHILNVKTSDAEAISVIKIHHSMGDGTSLMSLVLACARKTEDPESLPTVPVLKRHELFEGYLDRNKILRLLLVVWTVMRLIWNTVVDLLEFSATALFLKDTETPLTGRDNVGHNPKRFAHRTVSLDDIKLIKNAMKMTINDVLLGVTQAALSRYLDQQYGKRNEESREAMQSPNNVLNRIRIRATVPKNLRPTTGIKALADMMAKASKDRWGNCIGYMIFPFSINLQNNPLDYLTRAKSTIDRKKLSLEAVFTNSSAKLILNVFGVKAAAALVHRVVSNTTMSFSNVVGPMEEISLYRHPIAYIAPGVYGHPQALTIHCQSYSNKMTISLTVDPTVISHPHQLCDDLEESLNIIKAAVLERELLKGAS